MLKLSISLPNNAQINLESEDAVVIDKILGMVLADITRAILETPATAAPGGVRARVEESAVPATPSVQPSTSVEPPIAEHAVPFSEPSLLPADAGPSFIADQMDYPTPTSSGMTAQGQPLVSLQDIEEPPGKQESRLDMDNRVAHSWPQWEGPVNAAERPNGFPAAAGGYTAPTNLVPAVSEQAYVDFCRAANPLGDMRRVVVAAEGASRYLAMDGVDSEALGRLFDLAGWPRAHNFVQTLRNAARSKFGWLARIPGKAGHYSVTDLGRSTALGR